MNGILTLPVTVAPNFIKETLKVIKANGYWHNISGKLQYSLLYLQSIKPKNKENNQTEIYHRSSGFNWYM